MSLPLKKRPYSGGGSNFNKRLKRVERMSRNNRPEMQTKTFTLSATITAGTIGAIDLTAIAEGNSVDDRSGNRIKIWRIEVRGVADNYLDHYLIQQHSTVGPTAATFTGIAGAYLLDGESNTKFTEWAHYRNTHATGATDAVKFSRKFRGMVVKYNGAASTNGAENEMQYVVLNRDAVDHVVQVTVRVWFTDP